MGRVQVENRKEHTQVKKLISLVLTLCLLATVLVVPAMAAGFTAGTYTASTRASTAM